MRVAVLGAGGWGTALAMVLDKGGHEVRLWARRPEHAAEVAHHRENLAYLPGHRLADAICVTGHLAEALTGAELVLLVVPVQSLRVTLLPAAPLVPREAIRVGASKGIERTTLLRVSEVMSNIWGPGSYAVLSGPSFALEVAQGQPTAVTVAAADRSLAEHLQRAISVAEFRVYASDDLIGVEMAGALKNVLAIAAGIVRGLGYGSNTLAAVLTRGLAEMRRLGVALGGRPETFAGLAGMGDLLLTGTGKLSRNERVGEALASGLRAEGLFGDSHVVAEGVETARGALALARKHGVDMPITTEVCGALFDGLDPRQAVARLMRRDLGFE